MVLGEISTRIFTLHRIEDTMRIGLLLAALLLSGCSIISVPEWSETEYNELVTIAAVSSSGVCTVEQTERLFELSRHLKFYTASLPDNKLIAEGANNMLSTVDALNREAHQGTVSRMYCSLELNTIMQMANAMSRASGKKPK
jgi:hypothetical protein